MLIKVLEVLSHINKRIKPLSNIQLPLKELKEQFLDSKSTPLMINFIAIYLEMGFLRASEEVKTKFFFFLINQIFFFLGEKKFNIIYNSKYF